MFPCKISKYQRVKERRSLSWPFQFRKSTLSVEQGNELYFTKYWGFHDDLNYSGNNIIGRYTTTKELKLDRKVWSTCKLTASKYVFFFVFENFLVLDSVNAFNFLIMILLEDIFIWKFVSSRSEANIVCKSFLFILWAD